MLLTYRYPLLVVAIVSVILAVAGCGNKPVATVGGVKITETELNDRLVKTAGEDVLRSMIDRELLRSAASDKGIELTEEELAKEIEEAKSQYGGEEKFQQFLAANNLSEDEWQSEVQVMVLARKLALHGVNPSEEDLKAFFEQNREGFRQPATVLLSEIVVNSIEDATKVQEELAAGEASFADMVSRYSVGRTREMGGEWPETPIDRIGQPEIKQVAQNLPVGEVSDPVQIGESWVIFKVRDRKEGREASFETDRERIEEQYKMSNANSLSDILKDQMKKTNVNIVDPRFQELNADYAGMPEEIPQFGAEGANGDATPVPDGAEAPDAPEAPATPAESDGE